MSTHEDLLPKVDKANNNVEAAVDAGVEQVEQNPAEQAEALQTRLDTIVEANNELGVAVDDETRAAILDYAIDNPEAVAADAKMLEDNLPKTDGPKLAELASLAKAKAEEVAEMSDEESKGMVDSFCQKHFGGGLADVALACGEMVLPGSDILKAAMKGELPKGRDVARLLSGAIVPPIGTVAFDMLFPKEGGTPEEIRRAAIRGRLSADLILAIGFCLPEVATITEPASKVMREVTDQVEETAKKGDTTAADRAKAVGRGLIANKENLGEIAKGLGVEMTTDSVLERAGITGESAETVRAVGRIIAQNPDKAGRLLERMFAGSGGIVAEPEPYVPGPWDDGGIVEQRSTETPTGAIE